MKKVIIVTTAGCPTLSELEAVLGTVEVTFVNESEDARKLLSQPQHGYETLIDSSIFLHPAIVKAIFNVEVIDFEYFKRLRFVAQHQKMAAC